MKESIDKRLRLTDFMNAVIILLLMIGHGAYRETLHWAKLFNDKPLLRFVTYVGDRQGLDADIRDISYDESTSANSERILHILSRKWSFVVYQFPPETWDERYNHMIEVRGGSENIVRKGYLLIPVTPGEDKSVEMLRNFDEVGGPISSDVVLRAIGNRYRADIGRSLHRAREVPIFGPIDVIYRCIRLCFYRPMVALSFFFPQTIRGVASLMAYAPGLAAATLAVYCMRNNKEGR